VISDGSSFAEVLEHTIATVLGVAFDRDTAEIDSQLVELQEPIVTAGNLHLFCQLTLPIKLAYFPPVDMFPSNKKAAR